MHPYYRDPTVPRRTPNMQAAPEPSHDRSQRNHVHWYAPAAAAANGVGWNARQYRDPRARKTEMRTGANPRYPRRASLTFDEDPGVRFAPRSDHDFVRRTPTWEYSSGDPRTPHRRVYVRHDSQPRPRDEPFGSAPSAPHRTSRTPRSHPQYDFAQYDDPHHHYSGNQYQTPLPYSSVARPSPYSHQSYQYRDSPASSGAYATPSWDLPPRAPETASHISGPFHGHNKINMSPEDWPKGIAATAPPMFHPFFHATYDESESGAITWDMRHFPCGLHRITQRGVEVGITDKDMKMAACHPPMKTIKIQLPNLLRDLTVSKTGDLTVKDVLEAIWDHLQQTVTPAEYDSLDEEKRQRVTQAFYDRCKLAQFGVSKLERAQGVRRVDLLEVWRWFGGFQGIRTNSARDVLSGVLCLRL